MTIQKIGLGLVSFLQIVVLPLLYPGFTNISWTWQLGCAVLMVLALGGARMDWHQGLWLGAAALLSVLASVDQWRVLPLLWAQVVLAWLVLTQPLPARWQQTLWLLVVAFCQLGLLYLLMHVLTLTLMLVVALLTLPLIVAVWADRLPLVVIGVCLLVLAGVGYWCQQFTVVAAIAAVVVPIAVSSRILRPRPEWDACGGIVLALILTLTRLHG